MSPEILAEREVLHSESVWLWDGYLEIDRDGMSGVPTMRGMREVLDEYGVTDREERRFARKVWRQMFAKESEIREKRRKAEEEREKRKERSRSFGG